LLEGLVMGERAAATIVAELTGGAGSDGPGEPVALPAPTLGDPGLRPGLQSAMSRSAAIGRDDAGLAALEHLAADTAAARSAVTGRSGVEAANLAAASAALVAAARRRIESVGCHVRTDTPGRRTTRQASARA